MHLDTTLNRGYLKKPLWIYVAAALLLSAPLGNLVISLFSLKIQGWYLPHTWWRALEYVHPLRKAMMGALMVSGAGLLFVRSWAWIFAMGAVALVAFDNAMQIAARAPFNPLTMGLMLLASVTTLVLFASEKFRKPYNNPRLRWWETEPRFRAELPVQIEGIETLAVLEDISRSGALISWKDSNLFCLLASDATLVLPLGLKVKSKVVRRTPYGYGLEFKKMKWSERRVLSAWLRQLERNPRGLSPQVEGTSTLSRDRKAA